MPRQRNMRKIFSLASTAAPSALALAAGALALALTGCGSQHVAATTGQSGHPPATLVVVSEHNNGKTVNVAAGTKVELLLHSTYWKIAPSPHPSVLTQNGSQRALKPTVNCPPGVGCAPVEVTFTAAAPGTVMLSANRTSCGEALMCGPGQRHYQVTVVVGQG